MASAAPVATDTTGTLVPVPGPEESPRIVLLPAGVEGSRQDRYRDYPSKRLTPNRLISILEEADAGDPRRLIQTLEEVIEKDPKVQSVLQGRANSIQGLGWDVAPPKLDEESAGLADKAKEIARFCYHSLDSSNFRELRGDLMDAVAKPFAIDWITWTQNRKGQVVPRKFSRIPPTHIRWAFDKDEIRVFDPATPFVSNGSVGQALDPYTTVRALYLERRDHPTRAGVGRTLLWMAHFKTTQIKDALTNGDRFGVPMVILKIDEADFETPEKYRLYRAAVRELGSKGSGVVSKNADVEILEAASGKGFEIIIKNIDYFDKAIAWAVLGHELSSQSSPGQGQLGITAAMEARQDIKESDCEWLSEIIKRDIFTPLVGWNYGWDAVDAGLVPNLQFDYELPPDLDKESQVLDRVVRLFGKGLSCSKSQVRDTFGIRAPIGSDSDEEDDELIAQPVASPGGDGSGDSRGGSPEVTLPINSLGARRGAKTAEQPEVDALARRGIDAGAKTAEGWAAAIRDVLRECADKGLTFSQTRQRIVELYPVLNVSDLDTNLRQQLLLCRLWGRNGG